MKSNALPGPVSLPVTNKLAVGAAAPAGESSASLAQTSARPRDMGSVALVVLADLRSAAWAWSRLVLGPRAFAGTPGLGFAKVLGSGAGGGFGLAPSSTHRGLFLAFDDETQAREFIARSPVLAAYRDRAREMCWMLLRAYSCKGSWDGAAPRVTAEKPGADLAGADQTIVALTRASIKPLRALPFWRLSPPAEHDLQAAPGCLLAAGLGEAPLVRQATISLWTSTAAMDAYARSGAHQRAIAQSYAGGYFSESMFVRFRPLDLQGSWQGQRHG